MNKILRIILASLVVMLCSHASFGQRSDWLEKDIKNVETILKIMPVDDLTVQDIRDDPGHCYAEEEDLGFGAKRIYFSKRIDDSIISLTAIIFQDSIAYYEALLQESISRDLIRDHIKRARAQGTNLIYDKENSRLIHKKAIGPRMSDFQNAVKEELGEMKRVSIPKAINEDYEFLLSPMNDLRVGEVCGYGGTAPVGKEIMDTLVSRNHTSLIENILRGYNPAGRVYAAMALLRMKKRGYKLSDETRRTLEKVINLDIPISACQGCDVELKTAPEIISSQKSK